MTTTGPRVMHAVTVRAPATSANLGPGFDSVGLALGRYDEIDVRVLDAPGVTIHVAGEGAAELPRDETHLVVRAMFTAFDRLGSHRPGLSLRCRNSIPHGRGLGSSAAAIVAGVLAARALSGLGVEHGVDWVLCLASEIEGHPDNVAACLLGGMTIAWVEEDAAHAVRLEPAAGLGAVVFVPAESLPTSTARGLLPAMVPHADAAHTAGRAALLVEAMTRRPELLLAATDDRLHQQYRATAMPATTALIVRLRAAGVAAVVSGAGPSVLALVPPSGARLPDLAALAGPGWDVVELPAGASGAHVREASSVSAAAPSG